jgi:hypothetical protein
MKFSRSNFKMQRFESRSPRLESWRISIPKCGGSNPAASASQSVSNPSHMKVVQKPRCTARFRTYELVSVCGIWQWRRHSCLLSPGGFERGELIEPFAIPAPGFDRYQFLKRIEEQRLLLRG